MLSPLDSLHLINLSLTSLSLRSHDSDAALEIDTFVTALVVVQKVCEYMMQLESIRYTFYA